jgi:hypothetical protein
MRFDELNINHYEDHPIRNTAEDLRENFQRL